MSNITDKRFALIIACNDYYDVDMKKLEAPKPDAEALAQLLKDPGIGGFEEPKLVFNQPSYKIKEELISFLNDRKKDELALIYFAGHGIKGEGDEFYFASIETNRKILDATAVSSYSINKAMINSRCNRQLLLLDCCNIGAFPKDVFARSDEGVDFGRYFKGRGRVVLTASDAFQYAFEGEDLKKKGTVTSFFTSALLEGLRTGNADLDGDGLVSHQDLYNYLLYELKSKAPSQTPCLFADIQGDIMIAQSPKRTKIIIKEPPRSTNKELLLKLLQDAKIEEFNTIRKEEDMPISLRNIDLSKKKIIGVDLHEADLTRAVLIGTDMSLANLNRAILVNADLTESHLIRVDFYGANLHRANLTRADLKTAKLKGMVDFSEANLTEADLRESDLNGIVNFERAILNNADFTGSSSGKGLLNLRYAQMKNTKGLQFIGVNEYLESLKSFSEAINYQFKIYHTPIFQFKPVEQHLKEVMEEVENVKNSETISWIKKKNLKKKFIKLAEKIMDAIPDTNIFEILQPFDNLIEIKSIVNAVELYNKGQTYMKFPKYSDAIKCFDKALEINPDYVDAWTFKGDAYFFNGKYSKAIKNYDKALEINPDDPHALYSKGGSLKKLNKYNESTSLINEAIKYYDKDLEINPDYAETYRLKGNALLWLEKFDEAIKCFDKALEINPDYAEAYISKGNALGGLEKFDEAIKYYDTALEINPDYAETYYFKGNALTFLKKFDEAIKCFDKALEINPDYAETYRSKGIALTFLKKFDEAIKCFDKALEINPDYAEAYYLKGNALGGLEKFDEAIKCFDKALEINPDYAEAYYLKGNALTFLKKFDEAIKCSDTALEINPDYAEAYYLKGIALGGLEKFDEAIKCSDKALEINPDYAEAYYLKGIALGGLEKFDEAIKCFDKAKQLGYKQ